MDEFFGKSKGKKVRERKAEENNRKEDIFHGRVISIDVNTAAVEEKGALAAVYERSELPDEAPRLYVVVCHASLVPRRRYETFTIRYVTPFALRISKIYRATPKSRYFEATLRRDTPFPLLFLSNRVRSRATITMVLSNGEERVVAKYTSHVHSVMTVIPSGGGTKGNKKAQGWPANANGKS